MKRPSHSEYIPSQGLRANTNTDSTAWSSPVGSLNLDGVFRLSLKARKVALNLRLWQITAVLVFFFLFMPTVRGELQSGIRAPSVTMLPFFTLRSLARLFAAFILSLGFGIFYGIAAARSVRAERVLLPILDVLQSVPILGFFPAAIYFFIALFQGSQLGVEVAAVFLIFTSMAWNLAFAVYESVSTIPRDLQEASGAFGLRGWMLFRRELLPACIPKLIYNGIMSWAGGWYFLVAAETVVIGSESYNLPGIGRFIAETTYAGDFGDAVLAFGLLVGLILMIDVAVWRPLEGYAQRFKYEAVGETEAVHRGRSYASRLSGVLTRFPAPVGALLAASKAISPAITHGLSAIERTSERIHPRAWMKPSRSLKIGLWGFALVVAVLSAYVAAQLIIGQGAVFVASFYQLLFDPVVAENAVLIPAAILTSMARLTIAYFISLGWTLFIAIRMARNKRIFSFLMPVFQTFASIPATAYFPFLVVLVIGLPAGLEFASILLVLTGMQWYLLFNLIAGAKSVPGDLDEAARGLGLGGRTYMRKLMLPALYPSLVTGSITGWGGGWNALVVSEYVVFGATTYKVFGIGALLDMAAYELGSVALLLVSVMVLSATVVIINRLFWRRLYRYVIARYRID